VIKGWSYIEDLQQINVMTSFSNFVYAVSRRDSAYRLR